MRKDKPDPDGDGHLKELALDLITLRPLSRAELLQKLGKKGFERDELEPVADWLEELGLLNDSEYAVSVVEYYSGRGYGPGKIREEFRRRGVPRECWDKALLELPDPAGAIDDFLKKKMTGQDSLRELKRWTDALLRRGFDYSDISDGLRRHRLDLPED